MGRKYDLDMTQIYFYLASKTDGFKKIIFFDKKLRLIWSTECPSSEEIAKQTGVPEHEIEISRRCLMFKADLDLLNKVQSRQE